MSDDDKDIAGEMNAPRSAPRLSRLSKNKSVMEITNNPFAVAASGSDALHFENLQDAKLISSTQFKETIIDVLKGTTYVSQVISFPPFPFPCLNTFLSFLSLSSDNEERIELLEDRRFPFLFTSEQLLELCALQTSQKTQMRFIEIIAPRLIDPAAKASALTGLFRFNNEKNQVEELLRNRGNAINKTKTSVPGGGSVSALARSGRGAGRGGAGRGVAAGRGDDSSGSKRPQSMPLKLSKGIRSVFNLGRTKSGANFKKDEAADDKTKEASEDAAEGPDMGPLPTESTDEIPHALSEEDFTESPHINRTRKPFA